LDNGSLKPAIGQIVNSIAAEIHAIVEAAGLNTTTLDNHAAADAVHDHQLDNFGHFLIR
jgi:hypothetical protein